MVDEVNTNVASSSWGKGTKRRNPPVSLSKSSDSGKGDEDLYRPWVMAPEPTWVKGDANTWGVSNRNPGWPTPLKNMKVSWDDDIPNWMEKTCSKAPTSLSRIIGMMHDEPSPDP